MKTAASVFTWLGFGIGVVVIIAVLAVGEPVMYYDYDYYGEIYYYTGHIPYSAGIWCAMIGVLGIGLGIAIYRQKSVEEGHKVACGIITLIFVSIIGGILTLCIPENELNGYSVNNIPAQNNTVNTMIKSVNIYQNKPYKPLQASLSERDKTNKLNLYGSMLQKGTISQSEYEEKVALLGITDASEKAQNIEKVIQPDLKPTVTESDVVPVPEKIEEEKFTEEQKVNLLIKYKSLLDDGVISKEEFDLKKQKLLT
ncbi:MAG: SHOCT domain-containing protein [Clostridia bacterium]|nr:SHOCT domain-containing protein [Clostridia bacterium]